MNTRCFNNILCYNYIKIFIFHIKEHNNDISPQPSASSVLANGDPEPTTTSSDKSLPDSPQPSVSTICVRCVLKSIDFDRPLNTSYQRESQFSGAWLSELAGKLLQSHESLDLDNNLTLYVQNVAIPRGNGRASVAVNM